MTLSGALRELRGNHGYNGQAATLAPVDVSLLALPVPNFRPIPLDELLGESAASKLLDGLHKKILPEKEAAERRLLKRLDASNILVYRRSTECEVGIFAV